MKKIIIVIATFILVFIGYIYISNYLQYRNAISLLRQGKVETLVEGHTWLSFHLKDGDVIRIRSLIFAPYGRLSRELKECGEICNDVGWWTE